MRGAVHASKGEAENKCIRYEHQVGRNLVDSTQICRGENRARVKIEKRWERLALDGGTMEFMV